MEEVKAVLAKKVSKHEGKLKAHKESERILKAELFELDEKRKHLHEKVLASTKGVEYHTGKLKAYEKAKELLESK